MMNRGRVIQGRVEYWVEYRVDYWVDYQILGEFLSKKSQILTQIGWKKNFKWVLVEYSFDYDP